MEWYRISIDEVLKKLDSSNAGLSSAEALRRISKYGKNLLPEVKPPSIFSIFFRQFKSPLIYVLVGAGVVMFLMGERVDSLVIAFVFTINAIIGSIQEGRAQNTLKALKKFTTTTATVFRDGEEIILSDEELVIGDVVSLKEGDKVPADLRIINSQSLKVDESALTGESESVQKYFDATFSSEAITADQKNMLFKGTFVTSGESLAVVTTTGINTVIGAISRELKGIDVEMPLRKNIKKLSHIIIGVVFFVCVALFFIGKQNGLDTAEIFAVSVAVAVSAIPEGLPVVVTLVLATGVYRMGKRNALVKNLQAVEALGHANVIALDKTGTITLNQMMVAEIFESGQSFVITGNGYEPKGEVLKEGKNISPLEYSGIILSGKIGALTSSAHYAYSEKDKVWQRVSGDSTEVALSVFAKKIGLTKEVLSNEYKEIFEVPFNSDLKYHASIFSKEGINSLFIAGAPEVLIEKSTHIFDNGVSRKITEKEKEDLYKEVDSLSTKGLRVLALAMQEGVKETFDPLNLPEITLVSLVGIRDVVREEALSAVIRSQEAGVKVVMITGDYVTTAKAIALSVQIYKEGDLVLTGAQIEKMSEEELSSKIKDVSVFARVTPRHKMDIIKAYKKAGLTISMTGDGVNDALSLATADLGVSMGRSGTEVAKEASDIILLDDNFGSIVSAIEEGRSIYRTIKKVILYLFSTSLGEVLAISGAMIIGLPIPLSASQIIWLNFVTDGFLVVALAMEAKEGKLLSGPMTKSERKILDGAMAVRLVLMGFTMMAGALFLFSRYSFDLALASTVALTVLAVFQWMNALNVRSNIKSVFSNSIFSNPYLIGGFMAVILLQFLAVYSSFLQNILYTVPLEPIHWFEIIFVALSIILVDEFYKIIRKSTVFLKKI